MGLVYVCFFWCIFVFSSIHCDSDVDLFLYETISTPQAAKVTELPGGIIANRQRLERTRSPYLLREDLVVDWTGELVIEPGVEVRFSPQVGLTVRGALTARGNPEDRIVLTSASIPKKQTVFPQIRLVDGPSILAGRVQIQHNGHWRSVCTNSRNWTLADLETACRQLGFQGGSWWTWVDRQPGTKPRILYEEPKCRGTEMSLLECDWSSRQLGAGVCDYHPDLGIQCAPQHVTSSDIVHHWRGIRFENAKSERILTQQNTLYIRTSISELSYVDIRYAGSGRNYNASSAIDIQGTPPKMSFLNVLHSAYNGINITLPNAPVILYNCTLRNNRGYGLYVNSSSGLSYLDNCLVSDNGADGVRYIHHDEYANDNLDRTDIFDFCRFPTTASQTFPISITVEQSKYMPTQKDCSKYFFTQPGHVLTLHFVSIVTDRNGSALVNIYDGSSSSEPLLASVIIRNGTKPQSITTTRNNVFIQYKAEARTQLLAFMKLTSGYSKSYDLNITGSIVADNNGRGVAIESLRSQLHIHQSSISNNNHVAGVHVVSGVGDVNISDSRIAFNKGDGINITYTGGNQNITRSSLSSNKGYGIALWLNDTKETEYVAFSQETVVSFTEIFKNQDIGVLVGNFCANALVNITGNWFNNSMETAVEVQSCWLVANGTLKLQIGHNEFIQNNKLGIKLKPALNIDAKIEYNHFKEHSYGAILVTNQINHQIFEEFDVLPANVVIEYNEFIDNKGVFVVNLGLSPYSEVQKLLFTRNFVRNNRVREPFDYGEGGVARLIPRSRVAAPVVISSSNVDLFRNIFENPESNYEIGSHLEDQSKVINCTFNWLGFTAEEQIFKRLFHRKDRYNLAKIEYIPFLLHNSNPGSTRVMTQQLYVPQFSSLGSHTVGGEVDGIENLREGEYIVERDINIHPGGKLTLQPGVTLRFPPGVGMMVAGKLDARGRGPNDIRLTLKEERVNFASENETELMDLNESQIPVRLLGGRTNREGRLQVQIEGKWGTVCNYGWTVVNAALVCHQLGLVLNPDDWLLERSEVPSAGTAEDVILSNVRCTEDDMDLTTCRAEQATEFENSCSHANDVGLRCYESSWAGVRLGVLAEHSDLQFITIERAGLLDYATNTFKPALQIDFARHALENVRIVDNLQDGLGIIYSDLYATGAVNTVKNSEFSNNRGSGISFKQLGLKVTGSTLENNKVAGIRHNPALTSQEQRELAGWFKSSPDTRNTQYSPYRPVFIPSNVNEINVDNGETKYVITERVAQDDVKRLFYIKCKPGFVIGIQLLNPIHNRSTEQIIIYDGPQVSPNVPMLDMRRDLTTFPTVSSSFGIVMEYQSGSNALGETVIVISTIQAPVQDIKNRIVKGPIPTLTVIGSKIKGNRHGVWASYYNRYLNDIGDHHLRKSNESMQLFSCDLSHNIEDAILVHSPFWDVHYSNISEITFMINNTLITDNGRGVYQFSRDLRSSNNLFHWILQDNTIERNKAGGFDISLPYVWQYNENFTHSLYLSNNTWRNNQKFAFIIDGHFAKFNLTKNVFEDNQCKSGLISIRGMEKQMKIDTNHIVGNTGSYMIEFRADSQSEILGEVEAKMFENEIKNNRYRSTISKGVHQAYNTPSYVVGFHGIQKVSVNRNLFGNNALDYELLAGIRTAKIDNDVNVAENWWGTSDAIEIKKRIFDFDDWNNHAVAIFRPFLMEDSIESSVSVSWDPPSVVDLDSLGGRLKGALTLQPRGKPYVVNADITIMPGATLAIAPGVVMEFAPNVGILVLGVLLAKGRRSDEIIMRPIRKAHYEGSRVTRALPHLSRDSIRLCTGKNCTSVSAPDQQLDAPPVREGFLEYYNYTTMQWVPLCDDHFSERNAQVVCRELGFDPLNVYISHGVRVEYHSNSLSRIWSWPEPLQCTGTEMRFEDCPIRLNGQLYGHRHECHWNSEFVFIHCGETNLDHTQDYWGGIRFANGEFEQNLYEHRIHDVVTHMTSQRPESVLEYVNITGAGILHNEKSPAIQSIARSPVINNVNITRCASHGINLISPSDTTRLLFNSIEHTLGVGISALSLTGEGRESEESSFTPLKEVHLPYNLFSMIDICDTAKEITIEERVLVYYKYDSNPVNCVKIFNSVYFSKPFGFRFLQLNLLNSTGKPGRADSITLYDGDIYNVSSKIIGQVEVGSNNEKKFFKTRLPSMSVRLFAHGASNVHGFIAEIVTIPISAIGFNRDVQHNISYSVLSNNQEGAISYGSAGEVNPAVTMEWNQINENCQKMYGNFTTCKAAIHMDIQNTQNIYFRNNLVRKNQGGLLIRADSRGSATSLKGWIHNNLFVDNVNNPALFVEGRQSSPYQEVIIYRNFFTKNVVDYDNVIVLKQVVSNFTYNYIQDNTGLHILEVSGFEKVRLPIYQTTSHNGFYKNFAMDRDTRGTIVAGTAGQHYVDNVLYNPDNDYEIVTVNTSLNRDMWSLWKTSINAKHNYWSYNETLAVSGRIRDRTDAPDLLEVEFRPFHMNNETILNGKCPPSWMQVGDTCYIYIGAPMAFEEARSFCRSVNASMPYIMGNYLNLYKFLKLQQDTYQYYDHVWVQNIDRINKCTVFAYQQIDIDDCRQLNPFLCETDPKVLIDPLGWRDDILTVAVIGVVGLAILMVAIAAGFWYSKSRHRHVQRLERRNSIRQSLHSVRSVGLASTQASFADFSGMRKKNGPSQRSSPALMKGSEYKKMNGSLDSMDKSQFNSSVEDNQSYDIYEAHNPNASSARGFNYAGDFPRTTEAVNPGFDLAYKNDGFRDNSTFASRDNWQSSGNSVFNDDGPSTMDYLQNSSTLPLDTSLAMTDSTLDMKRGLDYENHDAYKPLSLKPAERYKYPHPPPPLDNFNSLGLPTPESQPSDSYLPYSTSESNYNGNLLETDIDDAEDRPKSHMLLQTDFDDEPSVPVRSKSEVLLETNIDLNEQSLYGANNFNRSRSQPLETSM